ncbi:MAG: spermidine synthase [Planctomycetota bacterium]
MAPPRFEILDYLDTPLGPLCLRRRDVLGRPGTQVTEVTLDHELLMSSLNVASEEALASRALDWHGGGEALRVLVGGLGLGYTAHAALQDPRVARVEVVEALPDVIRWLRDGLIPLSEALNQDPRCGVREADVYALLLGPAEEAWDSIQIDVDHSPSEPLGPTSAPFYTPAGLEAVAQHLSPGGVLAVWSAGSGEDLWFLDALRQVFPEAEAQEVPWTNRLVDEGQETADTLFLARKG